MEVEGAPRQSVQEAVEAISDAVRSGDLQLAQTIGAQAAVPLSLARNEINIDGPVPSGGQHQPRQLHQGAQGSVLRGTWGEQRVAVKRPRITCSADLQRFRRELGFLAALADQPHVVPLLAARALPPDYYMVLPLGGPSLAQVLHSPPTYSNGISTDSKVDHHQQQQQQQQQRQQQQQHPKICAAATDTGLRGPAAQWRGVIEAGKALAGALASAHSAGIVHRDVKPGNCILQRDVPPAHSSPPVDSLLTRPGQLAGALWLIDFGLACTVAELEAQSVPEFAAHHYRAIGAPSGGFHKRKLAGTLEYLAPEVLMKGSHSPASDVYALGVTLNEMATGMRPYADCSREEPGYHTVVEMGYGRMELSSAVTAKGLRPTLPPSSACPPGWLELVQECWAADPSCRPSTQQVEQRFSHLLEQLPIWQGSMVASQDVVMTDAQQSKAALPTDVQPIPFPAAAAPPSTPAGCNIHGKTIHCTGPRSSNVCITAGSFDDIGSRETQEDRHVMVVGPCDSVLAPLPVHQLPGFLQKQLHPQAHPQTNGSCPQGNGSTGAQGGRAAGEGMESIHPEAQPPSARPPIFQQQHHHHPQQHQPSPQLQAMSQGAQQHEYYLQQQQQHAPSCALFGVFDGHRGHQAAHFCASDLEATLRACLLGSPCVDSPAAALRQAFMMLEEGYAQLWCETCPQPELLQLAQAQNSAAPAASRASLPGVVYPGCTALAALVVEGMLLVANAGDGGCMLCRGGKPLMLSQPHTAASASERERVQSVGGAGSLTWHEKGGGHWRLTGSGLQVTRSIGDFDVKASTRGAVTAEPEVIQTAIQEDDEFLVLGSDGLWDTLQPHEVVRMVKDTVKHPTMCAKRLVAEAMQNGSRDNATAIVAFLHPVSTLERVFGGQE